MSESSLRIDKTGKNVTGCVNNSEKVIIPSEVTSIDRFAFLAVYLLST